MLDDAFPAARIGGGFRGSGTSQATAVVSGAAALLVGARPGLAPDQVKALLRATARPLPGTDTSLQGAGVINVAAAARSIAPDVSQRYPNARPGAGWRRGVFRDQYAVESPSANRWGANRWGANRWGANRWGANRWGANRCGAPIAGAPTAGAATAGRVSRREGIRDDWTSMESPDVTGLSWGASD